MILPGATLGILGGGQLGRMFAAEARRLGYGVVVVDPDPHAPAAQFADEHICLPWDDATIPARLAASCAAVTTEWENVPAELLRAVARHLPVHPGADAVAATQDRIVEKAFLRRHDIPTARWVEVTGDTDLEAAWAAIGGHSGILKTARFGYDGKGQARVASVADLATARDRLAVRCILEECVALEREVSVMVARSGDGEVTTWPAAENVHVDGILYTSMVPASLPVALATEASLLAIRIVAALEYAGVMGVECFVADGGRLLVNELAPRPHNSGHWTLDASTTSQFEQQVRILAGLPLGRTDLIAPVAMVNLLGDLWPEDGSPPWDEALAEPGIRLHLYGKRAARPGRKMGHLTTLQASASAALAQVRAAWGLLARGR